MEKAEKINIFENRLAHHLDELKWLYMEMYDRDDLFSELVEQMRSFFLKRKAELLNLDLGREADPDWYKSNDLLGMMLYIENFAGNLKGVQKKLDYLEECQVNYIHLMPFLDTPEGRSDGGYAVSDFRKVRKDLGTIQDLRALTSACHKKRINVCVDFVMNHTSEDHEWAKKARQNDPEYTSRYFFFENQDIPLQYEATVPQVFPTTAPGNFTWCEEAGQYVMTTFYPYQWDLNYQNPRVFNEMMYNFLFLSNCGVDVIRIDAVPYIWKELGTSCRNLPRVHTIVRMMRMIGEIVCPGVLLLGEVVMEPEKVVPYFGTVEKPECHMLYNVTTMATIWHTVATRDTRLLQKQLDIVGTLPKGYVFLNYLRCHDDIGWGLDYPTLHFDGMEEIPHKKYLNDYYQGFSGFSKSRGRLYNDDPVTMDARLCATTASMCGLEKALEENDPEQIDAAISLDLTLHAFMFMLSGIPVIYSGDEIGRLNDYTYELDPNKAEDSRYVHRGKFQWDKAEHRNQPGSVENRIFSFLKRLETLRKSEPAFVCEASMKTISTGDQELLAIRRDYQNGSQKDTLIGVFNFSERSRAFSLPAAGVSGVDEGSPDGSFASAGAEEFQDLLTGENIHDDILQIPPYGFVWMKSTRKV